MILIIKWHIILFCFSYIYSYTFRRKTLNSNNLLCGLFGFSGDPKLMDKNMVKAVIAKVKILGLYNIDRGKHSCGIYIDGAVQKGVDGDKLFSDFISNNELHDPNNSKNYTIIGHTRQATHGTHIKKNTHPFVVDDNFVLAHNGVIRNIWELCNKNGINHSDIQVDSMGLAELINKLGFKVLNDYKGYAALLMSKANEPNSLYMYRGISKRTATGEMEEERPLYYMQSEEGIYISSIEKSLLAISDNITDKVKIVEGGIVHKLTNGKMTKSKFNIHRDTVNIETYTTGNVTTYGNNAYFPGSGYPKVGVGTRTVNGTTTTTNNNSQEPVNYKPSTTFDKKIVPMIWHETLPARVEKYKNSSGVIYHLGRYWIVENDEIKQAHGRYWVNKKGKVCNYKIGDVGNIYFFEGVMMRNEKCYNLCSEDIDLVNEFYNYAQVISKYSEYPVCNTRANIQSSCKTIADYYKYRWFLNGNSVGNHGFTPKFSDRNYVMKDGLLHIIGLQPGLEIKGTSVNLESYVAERNGVSSNTSVSVIAPLQKTTEQLSEIKKEITQNLLPFKMDNNKKEYDLSNFYLRWKSICELRMTLSELELRAIRYYVADIMMIEMGMSPKNVYEHAVDVQLNIFFSLCIDTRLNLNESWDNQYNDITKYLEIAEKNPDGDIFESKEPVQDVCEFIPKTDADKHPLGVYNDVVVEENDPITDQIMKQWNGEIDKEPNPIDKAFDDEQAKVPSISESLDMYEAEEKDEKIYSVQDAVDFLADVRECADELQSLNDDDFAQEFANLIYTSIDPLLHSMKTLTEQHKETKLSQYIGKNLKERVGI